MDDNVIINKFYGAIIEDACKGYILYGRGGYNICFNTLVPSEDIDLRYKYDDIYVPTLVINNKEEFDRVLCDYVKIACEFYNADYNKVLSLLFVDATNEDFVNPVEYLKRRKNYILDERLEVLKNKQCRGYSEKLNGEVITELKKDSIVYETPYVLDVSLVNTYGQYIFPSISFGIDENCAYIYSLQKRNFTENPYQKKVNRELFKIGEGFDSKEDNFDKYDSGNLKDVSASFVVVSAYLIGVLEKMNINEIVLPAIRIVRYNNKYITNCFKSKRNFEDSKKLDENLLMNQSNITEKFLRTFLRVCHHFNGLDVISYPYEVDSNLRIINSGDLECNNKLLEEFYNLGKGLEVMKNACK